MQAVILAGGLGTRLGRLTASMPKVMVPIRRKPFLYYLLRLLKSRGMKHIVLCTGYLGHVVREYFGDGGTLGLSIKYSEEREQLLGTGGALKQTRALLDESFWVINGDTYLPADYERAGGVFLGQGLKALMMVYDNGIDTGVKNNVALDGRQRVVRYDKKDSSPEMKYVEAGVLALRRETLDIIDEGQPSSLEESIYQSLIGEGQMGALVTKERFYDIGTPEQSRAFEAFIGEAVE